MSSTNTLGSCQQPIHLQFDIDFFKKDLMEMVNKTKQRET